MFKIKVFVCFKHICTKNLPHIPSEGLETRLSLWSDLLCFCLCLCLFSHLCRILSKGGCHWRYRKQITRTTFATWAPITTINLNHCIRKIAIRKENSILEDFPDLNWALTPVSVQRNKGVQWQNCTKWWPCRFPGKFASHISSLQFFIFIYLMFPPHCIATHSHQSACGLSSELSPHTARTVQKFLLQAEIFWGADGERHRQVVNGSDLESLVTSLSPSSHCKVLARDWRCIQH